MKNIKIVFSVISVLILLILAYFAIDKGVFDAIDGYLQMISLFLLCFILAYGFGSFIYILSNALYAKLDKQEFVSFRFLNKKKIEGKKYDISGDRILEFTFLPTKKFGAFMNLMFGGFIVYILSCVFLILIFTLDIPTYIRTLFFGLSFGFVLVFINNTLPSTYGIPNDGLRAFRILENDEYFNDYIEGIRIDKAFSTLPVSEITFKKVVENNYESACNRILEYYQKLLLNDPSGREIIENLYNDSLTLSPRLKAKIIALYIFDLVYSKKDYGKARATFENIDSNYRSYIQDSKNPEILHCYLIYERHVLNKVISYDLEKMQKGLSNNLKDIIALGLK